MLKLCVNVNGVGFEELEDWLGTSFSYKFDMLKNWDFGYSLFTAAWVIGAESPVLVLNVPDDKCQELLAISPTNLRYNSALGVIASSIPLCLCGGKPLGDPLSRMGYPCYQTLSREDFVWACHLLTQFPIRVELNNSDAWVKSLPDINHNSYCDIQDMFWRYGDLQFAIDMFSEQPSAYPEEVSAEVISKFETLLQDWIPYGTKGEELSLRGKRLVTKPFVRGRMKNSIEDLRPYAGWLPVRGRHPRNHDIATLLATKQHGQSAASANPKPVIPKHLATSLFACERPVFRRYADNTETFDTVEISFTLPVYASEVGVREWVHDNSNDIISYALRYIAWTEEWQKYKMTINILRPARMTITSTHLLQLLFETRSEEKFDDKRREVTTEASRNI